MHVIGSWKHHEEATDPIVKRQTSSLKGHMIRVWYKHIYTCVGGSASTGL